MNILIVMSQDMCSTLWCKVGNSCQSRLEPAADGTECATKKVDILFRPLVYQMILVLQIDRHTILVIRLSC